MLLILNPLIIICMLDVKMLTSTMGNDVNARILCWMAFYFTRGKIRHILTEFKDHYISWSINTFNSLAWNTLNLAFLLYIIYAICKNGTACFCVERLQNFDSTWSVIMGDYFEALKSGIWANNGLLLSIRQIGANDLIFPYQYFT